MRPIYIFDLDGTLANAEHRTHHISGPTKDWRSFFAACIRDAPIYAVIRTLQTLRKQGAEIWIWTGRSDEVLTQTLEWLADYGIADGRTWRWDRVDGNRFRMRKAGDHRPDHDLKAEWLACVDQYDRKRIVAAFEDRSRVVDMWRANGVPCFQVAPGDF